MKYRVLWTYQANYADEPVIIEAEARNAASILSALRERLPFYKLSFFNDAAFHCFGGNGEYVRVAEGELSIFAPSLGTCAC